MKLSQTKYIKAILNRFNLSDFKVSNIPIEPKLHINSCSNEINSTKKPYREMIDCCLMYLMLGTRPDICFALNYFSRFQDKATDEAWEYLKRVFKYLKGTINFALEYTRSDVEESLICFVVSDYGGNLSYRKSVIGFVFKICNNTVMWATRKQNCVSTSTTYAELVALCTAVSEGLWLRKVLNDFGIIVKSITFYEDNQGCISIIKNPANNRRVKHMDIKYNFVSDNYKKKNINLIFIESRNQQADVLTKGLPAIAFNKFRNLLGLKDFSGGEY